MTRRIFVGFQFRPCCANAYENVLKWTPRPPKLTWMQILIVFWEGFAVSPIVLNDTVANSDYNSILEREFK